GGGLHCRNLVLAESFVPGGLPQIAVTRQTSRYVPGRSPLLADGSRLNKRLDVGKTLAKTSTKRQLRPWFALIEIPQRPQDLASLAPKRGLIPTEPVKRIGRQVG